MNTETQTQFQSASYQIRIPQPNTIRANIRVQLSDISPLSSEKVNFHSPDASKNPEGEAFASLPDNPGKYNGGYPDKRKLVKGSKGEPEAMEEIKIANIRVETPRKATINVDYFQIFGRCEKIPELVENQDVYEVSQNIRLIWKGHGTSLFNALYDVILHGEKIGQVQAFPRSRKQNMEEFNIVFKLDNHILYAEDWLNTFLDFVIESECQVLNVSRLDIAIDGVEEINDFLNHYFKTPEGIYERISIKNGGKIKHHPLDYDPKTRKSSRFVFGSTKSDKHISVYQKSEEIERSNKKYIERFWENSGMEWTEDESITRIEMRLYSKALSQIQGFDWTNLHSAKYLASIFKTQAHNFFDFYLKDDSNVSRCSRIKLIDYDMLGAELLSKTQKREVNDRYKAKLSLHLVYKWWFVGRLSDKDLEADFIQDMLYHFDLGGWVDKKIPHWAKKYQRDQPQTDSGHAGEQPDRDRVVRVEMASMMPP